MALLVYHVAFVGPRLRGLRATVDTHDGLLGGEGARATGRIVDLEGQVAALAAEGRRTQPRLAELERIARVDVPRVGFVRYNAFEDVGSDLSFALALLSAEGEGVVITSIYSREETRTYGKAVHGFSSVQDASKEERAAIEQTRTGNA